MKYIFLDIDGVLVPAKNWRAPEIHNDGFAVFSERSVRVLQNNITEDVTVILTTSHKTNYSLEEWKLIFKRRGLIIINIERLEENRNNLSRREELLKWFTQNEIPQNFVIIDDDKSLNDLPDELKGHLVLMSSTVGLTEIYILEIESILEK